VKGSIILCILLFGTIPTNTQAFAICPEKAGEPDTFALCAAAQCWTLDNVAYCKCEVLNQSSISLPYPYREDSERRNVCDLLLEGETNGFTVSTYATPRQILTDYRPKHELRGPPMALYTCNPSTFSRATNAYSAQCDGGVCFKATQGQFFPGLGQLTKDEIICSCPPERNTSSFQIAGPWRCKPGTRGNTAECCDRSFYQRYCGVQNISRTGTSLAVGSPAGIPVLLSTLLDGQAPKLNRCNFQ
jgi:hypothetical protein